MFSLFKKKPVIEFFCREDLYGVIPEPIPAYKNIPDWWKKLSQTHDGRDHFGSPSMTAKKCLPLLDAMSYGYIIPLQGDLQVITNSDKTIMKIIEPPMLKVAEYHSLEQVGGKSAPGYPLKPIKFINNWCVKTAPGWSTLFISPLNRLGEPFTCLSGLVDTDKYYKEVNFPAIWHAADFDDKLPAGTPLVLAIPVKRDNFPKSPVVRAITKEEEIDLAKMHKTQNSRSSYYTRELRDPRK
jgi:Family of unknown function (DUF6065)